MSENRDDCHNDTCQDTQIGGDRGTDLLSGTADSEDKGGDVCNVDTPSDMTKDETHKPEETPVTDSVSSISYSIEEVVCITGAWNDFRSREECYTKGCKWAPDGTCVVTNSVDNVLRVYDLPPELHCQETWDKDRNLSELKSVLAISVGRQVYDYSWYPLMSSGNPLSCCLVSTSKDNPVHMWDAFTGELRCSYRCFNQMDEIVTPHCVSFDTTGEKLYCGLKNMIKIFNTAYPGRNCDTRNLKLPMYQNETKIGIVSCVAVNPNLSSVYAVGTYLKTVGLYSEPDGQLLCFLKGQKGGVTHIAFSPDGTKLLSGGRKDSEIICWDLRNPGTVLFVLQREVTTNQRIYFDISPNGCYVMSGGTNGIVKIWDIQRPPDTSLGDPVLHPLKTFVAHNDCVNGLSIHKQYPVLATCSGQRHFEDLFSDSSSDTDQSPTEYDSDCRITKVKTKSENSLKLWWVGPKKQ
ncbi:telomerase Cajal body protein 1-like isoform X1 [Schistocerca gregaria]|uniref:telomerase Cajal body protein 1-like isoform X1 n=2 Tax=Schistocerca gregaria TaxID=7010 RepID=UPI00211DDF3D|nr:telomerase Cajal body protein 1-like isoform X1 [Schistocerca gregaria]